jgi:Cys-rich protein (TIGR01571 family)
MLSPPPQVLLGQVLHRLKLTWHGGEANHDGGRFPVATFRILAMIAAVHFCSSVIIYWTSYALFLEGLFGDNPAEMEDSFFLAHLRIFLNVAFAILLRVIIARARCRIRSRYGIPERTCHGCEDCCCAFWCMCCTVSQMARHTADYENYPAKCCSETGLSPNAPSIV